MTTEEIDLEMFCMTPDYDGRYALKAPFVIAGYRYATDGAVAVRMEATGEPDTVVEGKLPADIGEMFAKIKLGGEAIDIPPHNGLPTEFHDKWFRVAVDCSECGGSGGNCSECDGKGSIDEVPEAGYEGLAIAGRNYAHQYIWRIRDLPNVKLWPKAKCPRKDAIVFSFDGGLGLLMELRED